MRKRPRRTLELVSDPDTPIRTNAARALRMLGLADEEIEAFVRVFPSLSPRWRRSTLVMLHEGAALDEQQRRARITAMAPMSSTSVSDLVGICDVLSDCDRQHLLEKARFMATQAGAEPAGQAHRSALASTDASCRVTNRAGLRLVQGMHVSPLKNVSSVDIQSPQSMPGGGHE